MEYGWNIHDLMDVHYYFGYRSNGYLIRYTFFLLILFGILVTVVIRVVMKIMRYWDNADKFVLIDHIILDN